MLKIVPTLLTDPKLKGAVFDVKSHSVDLIAIDYVQKKILQHLINLLDKVKVPVWWERPHVHITPNFGDKLQEALQK